MSFNLRNLAYSLAVGFGALLVTPKADAQVRTKVILYDSLTIDLTLLYPKTGYLMEVSQDSLNRQQYKLVYHHEKDDVFYTNEYKIVDKDKDKKIYPSDITGVHATRYAYKERMIHKINATDTARTVTMSKYVVDQEDQATRQLITNDKSSFIESMMDMQFQPSAIDRRRNVKKEI
ncbi:MAG TPA: hypothetical protein VGF14_05465 [Alphaproteobacteria bacterium]